MNNFFSSIGTELAKSCNNVGNNKISNIQFNPNTFYPEPIEEFEILEILSSININKSNRPEDIPNSFIKLSKTVITPILTKLINLIFLQGKFPQILKNTSIIPIHKAGDDQQCCNHRPISMTSPFSKIVEKCMFKRMDNFLTKFNIINPRQFGFQKGVSTEDAVNSIYNNYINAIERNEITCSIFLDIKKAFDAVDHQLLLTKLYRYGFRGKFYELLKSFLSERYQLVMIQGVFSELQKVVCGVPQGSVLGPQFFKIFINDIPLISKFDTHIFADDTCLSITNTNPNLLEKIVITELGKISTWFKTNKLCLNYTKTWYMITTNKKINYNFNIKIDNHPILEAQEVKYLGVTIDKKLTWKSHLSNVVTKVSRGSYALSRLRHFVNMETLRKVYHALVHPHLQYCLMSWGTAAITNFNKLFVKQKIILKLMTFNIFNTPSNPIFLQLNLLKLPDMYKLKIAISTYNSTNTNNQNNNNIVPLDSIHNYGTRSRQRGDLFVPSVRTTKGQRSFTYQSSIIWNNIPLNIRKSTSVQIFKNKFKQYLISQYNLP